MKPKDNQQEKAKPAVLCVICVGVLLTFANITNLILCSSSNYFGMGIQGGIASHIAVFLNLGLLCVATLIGFLGPKQCGLGLAFQPSYRSLEIGSSAKSIARHRQASSAAKMAAASASVMVQAYKRLSQSSRTPDPQDRRNWQARSFRKNPASRQARNHTVLGRRTNPADTN